ncbi:ankyrin repeat domain-containing protein [Roseomonas gilardii subsp. gilardii]|uniref:ankyrin repeat domain-containing protein n=1 Tax=Roseomonas gilardii TaxID=257708 RepID=UPI001FFBCD89|nr:ankyrin repeat domain-containing protein [Roseomonas gilardii]UPG72540.1 ankyrin repeat domain-containing protein [Roseomonas gilardii subsp. gilardii]
MRRLLLASLATLLLPAAAAQAQFDPTRPRGPLQPNTPGAAPAMAPPPLPGAGNGPGGAIPSDKPVASMSPNDELFDAITRGDMAAARDAVSRGADLEARNVLGLTPIDAAVDRGRNDIAFYLLSARASFRPSGPSSPPPREAAAPRSGPSRSAAPREAARGRSPDSASSPRPTRTAEQAPGGRAPAGNGGTPRPEAGFLGFDGRGG